MGKCLWKVDLQFCQLFAAEVKIPIKRKVRKEARPTKLASYTHLYPTGLLILLEASKAQSWRALRRGPRGVA